MKEGRLALKLALAWALVLAVSACAGAQEENRPGDASLEARNEAVEHGLVPFTTVGRAPFGRKYSLAERMS
jgi:hypothetical protein